MNFIFKQTSVNQVPNTMNRSVARSANPVPHALASLCRLAAAFLAIACAVRSQRAMAANQYPPDLLTYQGYLTDANGNPLATNQPANFAVVFRIWNQSTGGTLLWGESQTVTVDHGNFATLLGQGSVNGTDAHNPLNTVFSAVDASDRYIEMTVTVNNTPSVIAPRLHLVPSPYAFLARTAISLYNNDGSSVLNLNASQISSGTVPDARLSSNVPLLSANNSFNGANTFNQNIRVNGSAVVTGNVNAGSFTGPGTVPIGTIVLWSSSSIPSGWARCDGGNYYGYWTPNLLDRFVVGAGASYGVGWTGGASQVTLSIWNLPPHQHDVVDAIFSEAQGSIWGNGVPGGWWVEGTPNKAGSHSTDGDNNGNLDEWRTTGNPHDIYGNWSSDSPFSILPPYYALYYIMRVQ
jgi:hypothetical protein